ncbi:MAG: DUF86 domain-containing protein [Candidatus Peregrinibacteria bacterium]|nr:DUF86 domain-containing protein [Candidatus Peregrinibacteria bacterium]
MNETYRKQLDYILSALTDMQKALERNREGGDDAIFFYYAAQKKAEEVIETAIALNQNILYDDFNHMTKSYYDSFIDLDRLKVMSEEELKKLAGTAGFRNRLAHEYVELDPQITVKSMELLLKLYPPYIKAMMKYLAK